ncbi:MAG: response regulator [Planctomycetota bacterium]
MESEKHYSLLLVDSNAESLFAMESQLSDQGFRVHSATSAEQAIAIGIKERLDLLVTQYQLDVGTGAVLAGRLRMIKRHRQLPVLYLNDRQMPGVLLRTCGNRPEYSLRAPVDMMALFQLVELTIESQQFYQPLREFSVPSQNVPSPHAPFPQIETGIGGVVEVNLVDNEP